MATRQDSGGQPLRLRRRLLAMTALAALPAAGILPATQALASTVHPVRGFLPDLRFRLTGENGDAVTQEAFRGKLVMLFFGYASCPDICPTTMAQLSQVVRNLGERGDQARVLFISVDPHRDTPDILQAYVRAFDAHAIGLTGDARQIADVAKRYRVSYQIEKPKDDAPDAGYEVAHSRGIYFFDGQGRARYLASDGESVEALTATARALLDEAGN